MIKAIVFDFYNVIYKPGLKEIDSKILSIFKFLSKKKIPIYLFTNTNKSHVESFDKRKKFLNLFSGQIYNEEYPKPQPEAFEKLITTLGINPNQIILIDDDLNNIKVAQQFGIIALQYINQSDLKNNLNNYINNDNSRKSPTALR